MDSRHPKPQDLQVTHMRLVGKETTACAAAEGWEGGRWGWKRVKELAGASPWGLNERGRTEGDAAEPCRVALANLGGAELFEDEEGGHQSLPLACMLKQCSCTP